MDGTTIADVRKAARVEQTRLAADAGTSGPALSLIERGHRDPQLATVVRLLRHLDHGLVVAPTTRASVLEWAATIRLELERGDREAANRAFLGFADVLQSESPTNRVILTASEPAPTGDVVFDAALAAISEYFLVAADAPLPAWVSDPRRVVDPPRAVLEGRSYRAEDVWLPEVPAAFLRRGALVEESTLASA